MVIRVAEAARATPGIDRVVVATDDRRIQQTVEFAGFEAVMTDPDLPSGTDRVAAAATELGGAEIVLNVQGDEPLIDPRDLAVLVQRMRDPGVGMGTLIRPLEERARFADPNLVKVVSTLDGRALYFSRAAIPCDSRAPAPPAIWLHVGIYAYRWPVLQQLTSLPPSSLETTERLEQLRALENGISIHVAKCVSERMNVAVDLPSDVALVEAELKLREQLRKQ